MKNIVMILGVFLISFSAFAQVENNVKQKDLKGPAYKNYKVWMDKSEPTKIYSENNKKPLVGPAYKNQQVLTDSSKKDLVVVNTTSNEKQKLTGPAYKNHGPWSRKSK